MPSRMSDKLVLINSQNAFHILNHKILLKKMYSVGFSATQLLGFLVRVIPLFTSFQLSIKNKFSNVASTNCRVVQQLTEFFLLGDSPHHPKICSFLYHFYFNFMVFIHMSCLFSFYLMFNIYIMMFLALKMV